MHKSRVGIIKSRDIEIFGLHVAFGKMFVITLGDESVVKEKNRFLKV